MRQTPRIVALKQACGFLITLKPLIYLLMILSFSSHLLLFSEHLEAPVKEKK